MEPAAPPNAAPPGQDPGGLKHYRTVFISDTHLGTPRCQAEKLLAFLHSFSADNLYLLGDILDFWEIGFTKYFPQQHWNVIRSLLGKAKHDTRVFYLPGNHDATVKRISPLENLGNVNVLDRCEYVTAEGKRLLLFHGDFVDRYLFFMKYPFSKFVADVVYYLLAILDLLTKPLFPSHRTLLIVIQLGLVRLRDYSRRFRKTVAGYARDQGYDGVVCGHDHSPGLGDEDGFLYVNCGDWVVNCTAVIEEEDGRLRLESFL